MILPIDDQYRIKSDPYCWIVQQRNTRKRADKEVSEWQSLTYHGSFKHALGSLRERLVRVSPAVGFVEALEAVKKISDTLTQACPGAYVDHVEGESIDE